ncbi:MAG: homoserine dehydrogenase [Microthrixaceae bacterium]|nr:homoserine dehydrogenase [Microthrixaceae bacterium]MCO5313483.1 homoserine dehydrogenase [Microthrixaceae bacterium]
MSDQVSEHGNGGATEVQRASRVRIGLLGCGNVGAALVELIGREAAAIERRTGIRLEIARIAVRSMLKDRGIAVSESMFTTDAAAIVADPDIDLVVEVLGGIEPARSLIATALQAGKPVVTANKELLANVGTELAAVADDAGVDLLFEAAVAGGIPLMRPLRESLVGERVTRVMGIVNGTTNFILSQMSDHGTGYAEALAEAQSLGFAERDPTADVEGFDAGAKAAIIATVAFGCRVVAGDVYHEGISNISAADIAYARQMGYLIKLLAICEQFDDGSVAVRVHPTMVPVDHPLAGVAGSFNAVFVEGEAVGDLMFYGRGAGGAPTASAVLGDVIDAAQNLSQSTHGSLGTLSQCRVRSIDELSSAFYLNLEVSDEPGVLAAVAGIFGEHDVSIRSMEQEGLGAQARLVFITHEASESSVRSTLKALTALSAVQRVNSVLRVIGPDS